MQVVWSEVANLESEVLWDDCGDDSQTGNSPPISQKFQPLLNSLNSFTTVFLVLYGVTLKRTSQRASGATELRAEQAGCGLTLITSACMMLTDCCKATSETFIQSHLYTKS